MSALGDVLRAIAKHLPVATEEILADINEKIVTLEAEIEAAKAPVAAPETPAEPAEPADPAASTPGSEAT